MWYQSSTWEWVQLSNKYKQLWTVSSTILYSHGFQRPRNYTRPYNSLWATKVHGLIFATAIQTDPKSLGYLKMAENYQRNLPHWKIKIHLFLNTRASYYMIIVNYFSTSVKTQSRDYITLYPQMEKASSLEIELSGSLNVIWMWVNKRYEIKKHIP